eukprot:6195715-Pleurochrysis_carterae.AAC.7
MKGSTTPFHAHQRGSYVHFRPQVVAFVVQSPVSRTTLPLLKSFWVLSASEVPKLYFGHCAHYRAHLLHFPFCMSHDSHKPAPRLPLKSALRVSLVP